MELNLKGKSSFYQYYKSLNEDEKEKLEEEIEDYLVKLLRKHCDIVNHTPKANRYIITDIQETLRQFEIFNNSQYPFYRKTFDKWNAYKISSQRNKAKSKGNKLYKDIAKLKRDNEKINEQLIARENELKNKKTASQKYVEFYKQYEIIYFDYDLKPKEKEFLKLRAIHKRTWFSSFLILFYRNQNNEIFSVTRDLNNLEGLKEFWESKFNPAYKDYRRKHPINKR